MNSLFKSLHKHVWSVLLIVLLSLLFTGCPKPSGSNNEGDESGSTSYTPSVREMFATKAVINFCTVDEMKELYRYEYDLFEGDNPTAIKHERRSDSTDFWIYIHAGEYRIKPLNPNTKYTLKIKYNLKSGETIDKTLEFTTKSYDFSDITIEYDADIYKKVIIESDEYYLDSSYDASIKIYRSETADGEYKEVSASKDSSSDSIKYYDDDKLESNKTYYYKLKVVKNNSDQVLFESAEPKSVTIGVVIPGKVDEDSIKISNGITAVKVEWEPVAGADCYIFSFGNRTYVSSFTANIVAAKEVTTTSYIVEGLEPGSDYTLKISAKNEGGTSREAAQKTFTLTEPSITGFKKVIGQEEAEFHINPSYDFVPEDCTVTYHMEDSLDNVIVPPTSPAAPSSPASSSSSSPPTPPPPTWAPSTATTDPAAGPMSARSEASRSIQCLRRTRRRELPVAPFIQWREPSKRPLSMWKASRLSPTPRSSGLAQTSAQRRLKRSVN